MSSPFPAITNVVVVIMCALVLTEALIQDTTKEYLKGKWIATSHTTLHQYSKVQCVRRCYEESRHGRCTVAGYDKPTKTCYLSVDSQQDLLHVADEALGVVLVNLGTIISVGVE